jgi:hypothetical protein
MGLARTGSAVIDTMPSPPRRFVLSSAAAVLALGIAFGIYWFQP